MTTTANPSAASFAACSSSANSVPMRLHQVRQLLAERKLAALLVPSADPHLSEYLPDHWQGRAWLSGFRGSVGTLIVTLEFAGLWADSR
jgi:Xaa-Pro aminopeptidase